MLLDPRRIVQIRKDRQLGQTAQFMNWRHRSMRAGGLLRMKDTQATVRARSPASPPAAAWGTDRDCLAVFVDLCHVVDILTSDPPLRS
jgi:hypothetical protein